MNRMKFCCQSVPGGWTTGVFFSAGTTFAQNPEPIYLIGPVFNDAFALWSWQADNLYSNPKGETT